MKKVVGVFLLLVSVGGFFAVKKYIGDVAPAVLPHISLVKQTPVPVKTGKPLDYPLHVADGFQIGVFAQNLGGVRDMTFSPGGVLLVSDTAGGKVLALYDKNNDGIADDVVTVLTDLRRPHGLAFYKNKLFVAEETRVARYIWAEKSAAGGELSIARLEKELFTLPSGGRHFTRSLVITDDGKMYVSLGSTCDTCVEKSPFLASVIVSDVEGKSPTVFASGLRNATFLALHPITHALWATEMGRDFLGDETPPDEINIITAGMNYGWPFCYGMKIADKTMQSGNDYCAKTTPPIYEIPAHSAPLGLTFVDGKFSQAWENDLLVAYHGSWNRSVATGYKVVHMHVQGNTITGVEDFLTGFLQDGTAVGRPVDMAFDKTGNLYISDDKSGTIYIVSKK